MSIFNVSQRGGLFARFSFITVSLGFAAFLVACQSNSIDNAAPPSADSYLNKFTIAQVDFNFEDADRPLLVDSIDREISASKTGGPVGRKISSFLGLADDRAYQRALEQAIAEAVRPHVFDALKPIFKGDRPARAVVDVRSVFIRDRMSLQQLTGARVFVNGKKMPDNAQFIAGLLLFDIQTGLPIQHVAPITKTDDGSIVIAGGPAKAPPYSKAKRLNQLSFEFAQSAANAIRRNADSEEFIIPASEGDMRTIWESKKQF